jgi:hypothetical protein
VQPGDKETTVPGLAPLPVNPTIKKRKRLIATSSPSTAEAAASAADGNPPVPERTITPILPDTLIPASPPLKKPKRTKSKAFIKKLPQLPKAKKPKANHTTDPSGGGRGARDRTTGDRLPSASQSLSDPPMFMTKKKETLQSSLVHKTKKREVQILRQECIIHCAKIIELCNGRHGVLQDKIMLENLRAMMTRYYNPSGYSIISKQEAATENGGKGEEYPPPPPPPPGYPRPLFTQDTSSSSSSASLAQSPRSEMPIGAPPVSDDIPDGHWRLIGSTLQMIGNYMGGIEQRVVDIENAYIQSIIDTLDLMESGGVPRSMYYGAANQKRNVQDLLQTILKNPISPVHLSDPTIPSLSSSETDGSSCKTGHHSIPNKEYHYCPHCREPITFLTDGLTNRLTGDSLLEEEDMKILAMIENPSNLPQGVTDNVLGETTRIDVHPAPSPISIIGVDSLQTQQMIQVLSKCGKNDTTRHDLPSSARNILYPPHTMKAASMYMNAAVLLGRTTKL